MNITIEQIIETLKDENKRKKIEEIICGEEPIFPHGNSATSFYVDFFKKINAEFKLYHIAKHLNKGWTPDWNNHSEGKWYLVYEYSTYKYDIFFANYTNDSVIYFKCKEMLPEIIRLMGEQSLKDYFMLED